MEPVKPTHRKKIGPNRKAGPQSRKPAKVLKPAYLKAKLGVSQPGDPEETQADQVAQEVSRASRTVISRQAEPEAEEETVLAKLNRQEEQEEETLQSRLYRQEEQEEETLQTRLYRQEEEEEPIQAKLCRQEEQEEEMLQARLYRQEEEEESLQTHLSRNPEEEENPTVDEEIEQRIENRRGMGRPLPDDVLADMEARFGRSFKRVRIHTDAEAAGLNARLNARAFTVGNDILFGAGEYAPITESGRHLLAHELAHVVQQRSGMVRKIQRNENQSETNGERFGEKKSGYIEFPSLAVPSELATKYSQLKPIILHKAYGRQRDDQRDVWQRTIGIQRARNKLESIATRRLGAGASPNRYLFEVPSAYEYPRRNEGRGRATAFLNATSIEECARQASLPKWDKQGNPHRSRGSRGRDSGSYDVDHIVEQRFGAQQPTGDFNLRADIHVPDNFFLLDGNINRNVKVHTLNRGINDALTRFCQNNNDQYSGRTFAQWGENLSGLKSRLSLKFLDATAGENINASGNNVWTKDDIEAGTHIDALNFESGSAARIYFRTVADLENQVPANRCMILFGTTRKTINPDAAGNYQNMLAPFRLTKIDNVENDDLLRFSIQLPANSNHLKSKNIDDPLVIKSLDGSERIGVAPTSRFPLLMGLHTLARGEQSSVLEHKQASPFSVEQWEIDSQAGLVIRGQIMPNLPLIRDAGIDFEIKGQDITLSKTFSITDINVPAPLSIDECSLTISAGTRGIGVNGQVDFSVEQLGDGYLRGMIGSDGKLGAEGSFNFNSSIFDPAEIIVGYSNDRFYGEGRIGIPNAKVPGIRSATITASFRDNRFSATGDAQLDVPGVDQGSLNVSYSEAEGFAVGGTFNLSADTPGIRGGSISAELRRRTDGEGYAITASGEAQPDIPGINSNLSVSYNDGAFTAEVTADYSRGMLSGQVNAGVTNRSVSENGELSENGNPENPLIVYGGGELTVQIAPWLQGTAGVQFAPNGEITVSGEIGIPNELEIFPRREINRSIFNIAVQVPIIPGIVAEIGGGLGAVAGIGPGVIDRLNLGITYNPAHEENTTITGDAHLRVPADAGLRLSVRAGIGLGITGASATGGLEIGGTLGIEGAAEAGVHVDWTPATGLDLSAEVSVHAQPSFTFDISGYVSVRALGFSVYDERWQLAAVTFGSDYRFGIRLPVHYREGEPFDISLDDVEFEIPDIDTDRLLRGLVDRIT